MKEWTTKFIIYRCHENFGRRKKQVLRTEFVVQWLGDPISHKICYFVCFLGEACSSACVSSPETAPARNNAEPSKKPPCQSQPQPALTIIRKLSDLTVSELKTEAKKRNLPVSGPKPNLLDRLKSYEEIIVAERIKEVQVIMRRFVILIYYLLIFSYY